MHRSLLGWFLFAAFALGLRGQTAPFVSSVVGGGPVDPGQSVTLIAAVNSAATGLTFRWEKDDVVIAGATQSSFRILAVTAADTGTYRVVATNVAGSSVATTTLSLRPPAPPVFTQHPRAAVVFVGQPITFSYTATGLFPRTHQWLKNGAPIAGATGSFLSLAAVTLADAGSYSVIVTNELGSVTSTAASLTVNAAVPPVLAGSHPFDTNVVEGEPGSLAVYVESGSTPYTFQWRKNGTPIPGAPTTASPLSGGVSSTLEFARVQLSDAGTYSVVVSNSAGSATSRNATLNVRPATPLAFLSQPESQTAYEGADFSLSGAVTGSTPITYQWLKDGTPLAGEPGSVYRVGIVTPAHAGSYVLRATNAVGTITSSPAVITVVPALAPTITRQPQSRTVDYGSQLLLDVEVTGSLPLLYRWMKDGVALGGASSSPSYGVIGTTPANSGGYSVEISNPGGRVTSAVAQITVRPAVAPVFRLQPASVTATPGLTFSLFAQVEAPASAGRVTLQWYRNGVPIVGATLDSYSVPSATEADAGDYTLVASGPGGTVTSNIARVTLAAAVPPRPSSWPRDQPAPPAYSTSFYIGLSESSGLSGSPPFTFQWFKDGVLLPAATSWSLDFPSVSVADYGTYTVTISNEGGTAGSPPFRLIPEAGGAAATPWLDAARQGDVVYFVYTNPARIERYDLAAEQWLPSVALTGATAPSAFAVSSDGVYVACGRTITRRALDLTGETTIATAAVASVSLLFAYRDWVYFGNAGASEFGRIHRTTLAPVSNVITTLSPWSVTGLPAQNRLLVIDYGRDVLGYVPVAADGTFGTGVSAGVGVRLPARPIVFPNERFVTDTYGHVFNTSSLSYAGALGERADDVAFFTDASAIVLRGNQLTAYTSEHGDQGGQARLDFIGRRIFTRGTAAFVFGAPASAAQSARVAKVSQSALTTPAWPSIGSASGRYSIDDAFVSSNGIVYIFSRSLGGFARWSTITRRYLEPVPLRMAPDVVYNQPGSDRVLVAYPGGMVAQLQMNASQPSDAQLTAVSERVSAFGDLGDLTFVQTAQSNSSSARDLIFGPDGVPRYTFGGTTGGPATLWDSTRRRLYEHYDRVTGFDGILHYLTVNSTGTQMSSDISQRFINNARGPIRRSPEGNHLVTGDGRIFTADLATAGALGNDVSDAAWLSADLLTLRALNGGTQVQRWSRTNYLLAGSLAIAGTPVRILRLNANQVVVVSNVLGFARLTIVNADLTIDAPAPSSLAGSYFGALAGTAGSFALHVRPDRSAVLLVYLNATRSALFATNLTLGTDGNFAVTARDPVTAANSRTIVGAIDASGVSGAIATLNATFSGTRATGSGAGGYFQATALEGAAGVAHAIVGTDGRAFALAWSGSTVEGGSGATTANGRVGVTTAQGTNLTLAIDAGSGALTATADRGALATVTFAGVRDDVPRIDRLGNISTRGRVGPGDDMMIAGFVVSGSAPRPILIRAIGPTLGSFGLTGALADPRLRLFRGESVLTESDNWGAESNATNITTAAASVGAFPLAATSRDAVLLTTLDPGAYTAQVSVASGSGGVSLVEVYDAGANRDAGTPRLINIATRGRVGTGEDLLIAGIVVAGNSPKRVLIRAVGPGLVPFGVTGTLADPVLTLRAGERVVQANDDWSISTAGQTAAEIIGAAGAVGAFALPNSSRDACLLLTLAPGNYTAQISGKGTATGVALVEVYEVP